MGKVPVQLEPTAIEVKSVFRSICEDVGAKELAFKLDFSAQNISNWGNPDAADRHLPAYVAVELCRTLENFRLLDRMEEMAGRTAVFFVPRTLVESHTNEDVKAVQALVKEVGEALGQLAETFKDGIVDDGEYDRTIPELDDVIHECVRLKHWLKRRLEADRNRSPQPTAPFGRDSSPAGLSSERTGPSDSHRH